MRRQRRATGHRPLCQWPLFGVALLVLGSGISAPAVAGNHSTVVTVTAYNDVPGETDAHPHIGAWNNHLGPDTVAASPDLVARGLDDGTTVAIEGYKRKFVVRDKTSDDVHDTIDIYMGKNVDKARAFGEKRLRIWRHTPDD
ncbi:3D domain-containing protein [Salinisphaera sp.]|uniref:3D domain-containing protein n=1 Tax=Salinisphaera sp. TaxID=1914330 RepID=UPI003C7DA3E9